MLKKFNEQNLDNEIKNGTILVDVYADWCGACKMVAPVVDEIANARPDITVIKVNVDEHSSLASQYGVFSIPTLITFKEGNEKARLVGYKPKTHMLAML